MAGQRFRFEMNMTRSQWNDRIRLLRGAVTNCPIPPGIEPGQAKSILAQLDTIYCEVRLMYGDIIKYAKEIERLIYKSENMNRVGSNDIARKAAAVQATDRYDIDGMEVSLYDLEVDIRGRQEDTEAIIDIIRKKTDMIITMSGLLKIEGNLMPRS